MVLNIFNLFDVCGPLFSVEMYEKDEIVTPIFTKCEIRRLKDHFKNEINSKRRFEAISTIEELFNVLEDRDALTDDVLLALEPNFKIFVDSKRTKTVETPKLIIPQNVVTFLKENCSDEWKNLGMHLKLSTEQIIQCRNVEDILCLFKENCSGVSPQEMTFRLNRALEKCGKESLRGTVTELMLSKST